jgi:hypothetical protein
MGPPRRGEAARQSGKSQRRWDAGETKTKQNKTQKKRQRDSTNRTRGQVEGKARQDKKRKLAEGGPIDTNKGVAGS